MQGAARLPSSAAATTRHHQPKRRPSVAAVAGQRFRRGGDRFEHMKGMSGIELCKKVVANRERHSGRIRDHAAFGSMETAVAAIRAGAYDFVTKPFEMDTLALTLERAKQHRTLREEIKRLRRAVRSAPGFEDIIGQARVDAKGLRPVATFAGDRRHRFDQRGERHRQGVGRARVAQARSAQRRAVHCDQLRGDARAAFGERAFRTRAWRVHRCQDLTHGVSS